MDYEFFILNYIQNHFRTGFLDKLMPVISSLGTASIALIVIALVCCFIKKTRYFGRSLVLDLLMNFIAGNLIIKPIVSRLRPCVLNDTVSMLVKIPFDASLPSGHSMFAFGAATILFIYNKWLGIAGYLFAILMGFSRMYLYVHFPSDVLCGAILGIIFAIVIYQLEQLFFDHNRAPIHLRKISAKQGTHS